MPAINIIWQVISLVLCACYPYLVFTVVMSVLCALLHCQVCYDTAALAARQHL